MLIDVFHQHAIGTTAFWDVRINIFPQSIDHIKN
jgi:hypothetical protein